MLTRFTLATFSTLSLLVASPVGATTERHLIHRHSHKIVAGVPKAKPTQTFGIVSALVMSLASNVNHCEESGNWHVDGPTYFGGLGWLWATWQDWRQPTDPVNMAQATPPEQARAMARFVGHVLGGWWPDQPLGNCTGGY